MNDTEFFSQGILSIICLGWIIERKCWGWARWELIQSSDPHLQLSRGHQNKLRASCAGWPGWAGRWSLDLGPGDTPALAASGARHQGWQHDPDAGLSLVSGANTGLWLAARVTPLTWSQMRGDEMQPEIIKFLPVGGSVMYSTRPVLCNAPTWHYPLLHVFMASLNTMLQSSLSALMGAKCKMIQRINIVPRVIPCH